MALFGGETVEGFGCSKGVALQKSVTVLLHLLYTLLVVADGFQLPYGGGADLLQVRKLRPQLLKGNVALGGHVLKAASLALYLGKLAQPRLRLLFGFAVYPLALFLDHRVQIGP